VTGQHAAWRAAYDKLPVLEQGGMVINFCETEKSDTSGQLKHQAHQDGSSGATTHELIVPELQKDGNRLVRNRGIGCTISSSGWQFGSCFT
jgi:hypothetical protein